MCGRERMFVVGRTIAERLSESQRYACDFDRRSEVGFSTSLLWSGVYEYFEGAGPARAAIPADNGRTSTERPLTNSPSVDRAAHNQRTAAHEWRIALELSAQSSSSMRRKLWLYTALPIAFPKRSPAT
jgi:hypothetical protein